MTRPPTSGSEAHASPPSYAAPSSVSKCAVAQEPEVRWSLADRAVMDAPRSCICFSSASSSDDHGRLSSWRGLTAPNHYQREQESEKVNRVFICVPPTRRPN
jgi:hypothetical protein